LIFTVGIELADTGFSRWRKAGEDLAKALNVTRLRAGLVLGDTSYDGSSLMRSLATLSFGEPSRLGGKYCWAYRGFHAPWAISTTALALLRGWGSTEGNPWRRRGFYNFHL